MKKLLLFLFAVPVLAQYPQISVGGPARPTMVVGSTTYNIGTSTVWNGTGAPGVLSLSVVGDTYLDTAANVVYTCFAGFAPCTSWILPAGGGGGSPTGAAGGALAGTYPNPTLASVTTAGSCGDSTHTPVFTRNAAGQVTACTSTAIAVSGLTLQTGGVANSSQVLLNLAAGTGISLANVTGTTTITNTGIPVFQTNTVSNSNQALLNLIAGSGIGLSASGGNITITSSGGGGGGGSVDPSGTITNTAIVTAAGPTLIQTPSATTTLDSSGNMNVAGYMKALDSYPTVLQTSGCDPTGVSDSTTCFNTALAAAAGSALVIPAGTYKVGKLNIPSNITLIGYGVASRLNRNGAIAANSGWLDLANKSNVRLTNFMMDGQVTSSTGVDYTTVTDPMQANFTLNTTIWAHGGTNIVLDHLLIQHTGGYAVLIDASSNNVSGFAITNSTFQDNRPFLFGVGGDLTYGAWPGGILWRSNGTAQNIQNLSITDNVMQRISGHAVWGNTASTSPTLLNKNVTISRNQFADIGLDGILAGPVDGWTAQNNNFLRTGYVSTSDGAAGAPKWFNAFVSAIPTSIPAVAIDTTGLVLDFVISGNTMVAHNGGCIDLDDAGFGSVSDNHCYIPQSGDPEYTDAQPSSWGPAVGPGVGTPGLNYMYGINTGNTHATTQGASHITITGNSIYGQGGGGVRLYAARYVIVQGNDIFSPSTVFYPPIVIGNRGTGTNVRAYNNEVANNKITYTGSTGVAAVLEDTQYAVFQSGDVNRVHDNALTGNLSEFFKASSSSSINYGASTVTSGACSGTSACTTLSKTLTSNSTYGSSSVFSITTQAELSGGNTLYRWYAPGGGVIMATLSTDGSLTLGNGAIGSLWTGGSLAMDNSRNFFGNSLSVGGSIVVDSSRNIVANSLTSVTGSALLIDSSRNFFGNSLSINGTVAVDNARNMFASALFNGGQQSIDSSRNAFLASITSTGSVPIVDSALNLYGTSLSIGGSPLINASRQIVGVLSTPNGIASGSGITAPGFNPTGFTGSTITLQVSCTVSGGFCTNVFFVVGGTNYANVDITGGVVRGVH